MSTSIEYREIEVGSNLHKSEQALRDEVLRKPLGRRLSATDIERDREGRHFVGVLNGAVVACVGLYPQSEGVVRLRQMAVSPRLQGQGMGAGVLRHAEAWARSNGVTRIETHARMVALGFYEKQGYTAEGDVFEEVSVPHRKMWKALI